MRNRIGIGTLLVFSFVSVILILVIGIGYFSMTHERLVYKKDQDFIVQEFTKIQRGIIKTEVDRKVELVRDTIFEKRYSGDSLRNRQADLLRNISHVDIGGNGYMFVVSLDGVLLGHPWMKKDIGKNMLGATDENGKYIFVDIIETGREDGGGYVTYSWPKPRGESPLRKIVYVRSVPEWGWVICAGIYVDDMERALDTWKDRQKQAMKSEWRVMIVAFLSAVLISLAISLFFSWIIRKEFTVFARFFKTAAIEHERIDSSRLSLAEFADLADSANRMLDEHREADEAVRSGRRLFSAIVKDLPVMLCRSLPDGTLTFVNEAYCRFFRKTPEYLLGKTIFSFMPENYHDTVRSHFQLLTPENPVNTYEHPVFLPSGEIRWQKWTDRAIIREGEVVEFQSIGEDITESKRAEEALRKSEERLQYAMNATSDGLWDWDIASDTGYNSPGYYRMLGYEPDEFPANGKEWRDRLHPEDLERTLKENLDCTNNVIPSFEVEFRMRTKTGGWRWILGRGKAASRDADGKAIRMVGTHQDITARKQAEEALLESERRFRSLVEEENSFPIQGYDRDLNVIFWNTASEKLYGYTREEATGKRLVDLIIPPYMRKAVIELNDIWLREGTPVPSGELDLLHKDGSVVPVYSRHVFLRDRNGKPEMYCIDMSLAERRKAEKELRLHTERLQSLLCLNQMTGITIGETAEFSLEEAVRLTGSAIGYLVFVGENGTVTNMYAWPKKSANDSAAREMPPDFPIENLCLLRETIRRQAPVIDNEYSVPHPEKNGCPGKHGPIRRYIAAPVFSGGRIVLMAAMGNKEEEYDKTDLQHLTLLMEGVWLLKERKQGEEALIEEKERLAVTLRSIGDGVITTDRNGGIILLNRVAEELTGWTQADASGRPLEDVFHIVNEKTRERCENPAKMVLETAGIVELANHTLLIAKDGREIVIADSGAPILDHDSRIIGVVLVFRDVTAQKRIEDELLRIEKLESVGVLAGGIAHDFNNILTGVLGSISLARIFLDPEHESQELLVEAERQALRARDLTGQLLTFSKGGSPMIISASIVETVRETVSFVLRGSRVRAEFWLPEDLWTARADLNQLSQVINNLARNAVQAMPNGGSIEVAARNIEVDDRRTLPLEEGKYIELSIRDYGIGIPREYLSRIFDPYFTTKQMGSGLGLATTYSIINRHDGHIRVESEVGTGTVFYLYLPASGEAAPVHKKEPEGLQMGHGLILVMDDEDNIRNTTSHLLHALGYKTETVDEGSKAVELYRERMESGTPFDAVIMDMTIPGGMGGIETMREILTLNPDVRAIVSSGYSNDPVMAEYRRHGFAGVLVKPYRVEDLGRVLRTVLGEEREE